MDGTYPAAFYWVTWNGNCEGSIRVSYTPRRPWVAQKRDGSKMARRILKASVW